MENRSNSRLNTTRKKKKTVKHVFLSLFAVGLVCALIGGYIWLSSEFGPVKPVSEVAPPVFFTPSVDPAIETPPAETSSEGLERDVTVILAGTDLDDYHTDTLMVANLDTVNHTLDVLSIPRDTQVDVPWSIKKINAAWGANDQDISLMKELLQSVIGFQPDHYVVVDLQGFMDLIDAINGVDYDVPQRMRYTDASQDLYIDLEPGMQHLNGQQAMGLVRYRRYMEGDPKRIQVQQDFLTEVFNQTLAAKNVFKIPEFVEIANKSVRTDLSSGNMTWFMQQLLDLEEGSIRFHTLPGNPSAYWHGQNYFIVDAEETVKLVNEFINPFSQQITEENLNVVEYVDEYR